MNAIDIVRNLITLARVNRSGIKPQLRWLGDRVAPDVQVMRQQGVYFGEPPAAQCALLCPGGDPSVGVAVGLGAATPDAPPDGEGGLHYLGTWRVYVNAAGEVHLGEEVAADFVALASLVSTELNAIKAAFDSHTHVYNPGPSPPAPTAPPAAPMPAPGSVAATKVKAT